MFKKILAGALATSLLVPLPVAAAENVKAEELREIVKSNHCYIEYELNRKEDKRALIIDGENRKSFDCEGRRSATLLRFIPIVGMFAKGSLKLMPEVYYDSNNYYQFLTKKKALCATPENMEDPYLNPNQEWDKVPLRIEMPEEFGMFAGNTEIEFVESVHRKTKGKKNNLVDKYVKNIRNVNGETIAKKYYFVYYDKKNELEQILTMILDLNENPEKVLDLDENKKPEKQTYDIQCFKINEFTSEFPEKLIRLKKGCKIYAPGLGDMNELLEMPPLLEVVGKEGEDE